MYHYQASVTRVVDGDTFDADVDLGFGITFSQRFRVESVDTPEIYRPRNDSEKVHGHQAKDLAVSLLIGKPLFIESKKTPGIYGRYSAKVTLEDGRDFSAVMIESGMQKSESY